MVGFYFIYRNGQVVRNHQYFPGVAPEPGEDVIFGVSDTAGVTDKSLRHPGPPSNKVPGKDSKQTHLYKGCTVAVSAIHVDSRVTRSVLPFKSLIFLFSKP